MSWITDASEAYEQYSQMEQKKSDAKIADSNKTIAVANANAIDSQINARNSSTQSSMNSNTLMIGGAVAFGVVVLVFAMKD